MDAGLYYGSSGKRPHQDDYGVERNGRYKKANLHEEHPMLATEDTEYRILCPATKIGSLIGKGGSIIKGLRTECKSKIKVEDPVPGSDERVVLICAASDQLKEGSSYVCNAQEALFKVHARIADDEDDDEPPQPMTARLLVPKNHIGCLLGKGGKIIEQMRKESGAQIRILPKEQHPPCAASTDELVQVSGDGSVVKKALFEISSRIHDNITGEKSHRGSTPLVPSVSGAGMYAASGYMPPGGSLLSPSSLGGPMTGLGYSYAGMYGDSGMASAWHPGSGMPLQPVVNRGDGGEEEELIIRLLCPNSRVGSIIGKGGSIIKKMREETGAKIKVGEQRSDWEECVIEVYSAEYPDSYPSSGIQAALLVSRRLLDMQMDKDKDYRSFIVRMLVPKSQIGCLLGKGGSIVSEMRKITKANIRISPKDEPSKCAEENDELVQIMGDQNVVQDALIQILDRLRNNLFKAHDIQDMGATYGSSMLPSSASLYSGPNMLGGYGGRFDSASLGAIYPLTNVGYYGVEYGYGGYGAATLTGAGLSSARSQSSLSVDANAKESRRHQR